MSDFLIGKQQQPNWCWAAVSSAVFKFFFPSTPVSQTQIAKQLTGGLDQPQALEDALDAANALIGQNLSKTTVDDAADFDLVRARIDQALPVCARIQWSGTNRGHYVVIVGYSITDTGEKWLDIADPLYLDSTLPYESFCSGYESAGEWKNTYFVTN